MRTGRESWGSSAWRRLPGDLTVAFQYLKVAYRKGGEGLFIRAHSDGIRGNGFKLEEGRFRLDLDFRKKLFIVSVVRCWNRLPSEAVGALTLEVFKARLDGAFNNLVWREVSLPIVGDWN